MEPKLAHRTAVLIYIIPMIQISAAVALGQENIRFRRLSVEDGLSQSTVNCVLQDHEGFIWLGTQDGLNRYDGYSFKVYRHNSHDSLSISDNYINSVFEDSRGRLWIGTYSGGLNVYDRDRDAFSHFVRDTTLHSSISGNIPRWILPGCGGTTPRDTALMLHV
jgi:ligand-binding sensor domain-containing protein